MIDDAYNYLIGKTTSIVYSVSENFTPNAPTLCAVYRCTGGIASKTLSKNRQYIGYTFNVLVRGNQDSEELVDICDAMVLALDMDTTNIMTLVTSEPQYAFTDDNGNLNYTFNIEVLI